MNEKRIMAETDHPFCIRLIAAYKDRTHLYMVLEYCAGGGLLEAANAAVAAAAPAIAAGGKSSGSRDKSSSNAKFFFAHGEEIGNHFFPVRG